MSPTRDIVDLPVLPPRRAEGHKGDYGRVLVVAGSLGMSGAAVLAGHAALRGGAGLVRVATPASIQPLVAQGHPCLITVPLAEDSSGRIAGPALSTILAHADAVVALGPGLGRSPDLDRLVPDLIDRLKLPTVVDADGLNAIDVARLGRRAAPLVLTPHPGEFARLVGLSTSAVQSRRRELAEQFARDHDVVLLLKGHATVVTNGRETFINATGNPGMATAGSGDVLTGLIAALLGQGLPPFDAARLGAYLHGLAGDLARDNLGEECLIATDLIDWLPRAWRHHRSAKRL